MPSLGPALFEYHKPQRLFLQKTGTIRPKTISQELIIICRYSAFNLIFNPSMAFRYPISSQWITFPTDLKAHALIEWKENNLNSRDALYYYVKCFWGDLKIRSPNDGSDATQHHADRLAGRLGNVFTGVDGEINIIGASTTRILFHLY
jgi:hypothetical protein